MPVSQITALIQRHQGLCHYCNCKTFRMPGSQAAFNTATKDHVVPRAFGGSNTLDNYVLACYDCNNRRGTTLFYCQCEHCSSLINNALNNPEFIQSVFHGIVQHNRVKVYMEKTRYVARLGHVRRTFDTFDEAIHYAHNGAFTKGQ